MESPVLSRIRAGEYCILKTKPDNAPESPWSQGERREIHEFKSRKGKSQAQRGYKNYLVLSFFKWMQLVPLFAELPASPRLPGWDSRCGINGIIFRLSGGIRPGSSGRNTGANLSQGDFPLKK
ncbi:MAG: hypothetical protein V3V56_03885, partial [bacterium]